MAQPRAYFPAIDGLRLLASLNIVFLHLESSAAFAYAKSWTWLAPIVSGPAFSAGIFFVLAGFLFASKFSEPERRLPVVPFMFARIAKLYRLHFCSTILMFIAVAVKLGGLENMDHPFRSLILHLTFLWSLVPDLGMKLNEPSWALTGFFICYAITPAAAKWLFKIEGKKTLWLLFFASFIPGIVQGLCFGLPGFESSADYARRFRFFHMFPAMHVSEYLFGMVIFRLYQKRQFAFLERDYVAGFMQAFLFFALYGFCYLGQNGVQNPSLYFIVRHSPTILISGLFIMSLIPGKGFLAHFFCIPIVRTIGRASFYPYLLHLPLITIGWGLCNMNTPRATLGLILILYTASPLYLSFKNKRKKKKAERKAALAAAKANQA